MHCRSSRITMYIKITDMYPHVNILATILRIILVLLMSLRIEKCWLQMKQGKHLCQKIFDMQENNRVWNRMNASWCKCT